jgi:hypothetical protein
VLLEGILIIAGGVLLGLGAAETQRYLRLRRVHILPTSKVTYGLTEVHGLVHAMEQIRSPISGSPCVAYRVQLLTAPAKTKEAVLGEEGLHTTRAENEELAYRDFLLRDHEGTIRVQPAKARLRLPWRRAYKCLYSSQHSITIADVLDGTSGIHLEEIMLDDAIKELRAGVNNQNHHTTFIFESYLEHNEEAHVLGTASSYVDGSATIAAHHNPQLLVISSGPQPVLPENKLLVAASTLIAGATLVTTGAAMLL